MYGEKERKQCPECVNSIDNNNMNFIQRGKNLTRRKYYWTRAAGFRDFGFGTVCLFRTGTEEEGREMINLDRRGSLTGRRLMIARRHADDEDKLFLYDKENEKKEERKKRKKQSPASIHIYSV